MGLFKKLIDLLVAIFKLGFVYIVYEWDFLYVKYFNQLVKKPHKTQSKIQDDEYVSTREYNF
jgi:hypothetical protein